MLLYIAFATAHQRMLRMCNREKTSHGWTGTWFDDVLRGPSTKVCNYAHSLANPNAPPIVRKKLRADVTTALSGAAVVFKAAISADIVSTATSSMYFATQPRTH